jgi:hypothetical protein
MLIVGAVRAVRVVGLNIDQLSHNLHVGSLDAQQGQEAAQVKLG